jgi:uncharacterized protein (TIGR02466 family)
MTKSLPKKTPKNLMSETKETPVEVVLNNQLQVAHHFPCPIYLIERPDFLETVNAVSEENLEASRKQGKLNEIYPVYMTNSFYGDPRMAEFSNFVGATAWNILNEQGYAMQNLAVSFTEMWTQEHHKHSAMDAHVHGFGSQIVGFYFLETPEEGSRVVFHDPRTAKVQIDLPERDISMATPASKAVNFTPKPGLMIFANSWLSHSFSRHAADKPIKFVHFNLTVVPSVKQAGDIPAAEIV